MSHERNDPFVDEHGNPCVVRGVLILSYAPRVAELAGLVGFDTVWLDLEHASLSYTEAETLCMAAEAAGMVPTMRIQDCQRTHVLRAVEAGARILVVPMINTAAQAREIVAHGKFGPLGKRGFNTTSRGTRYGIAGLEESLRDANARTHFIAQIETLEAVGNLEAICAVEGLAGIFVGPGDLSTDMGKPGQFDDPDVIAQVADCIERARACGKHAGILAVPGPLLDASIQAGADLIFIGSDLGLLAKTWREQLSELTGE